MSMTWIEYKDKMILYVDYQGKTKEEMLKLLEEEGELYRNSNPDEQFLTIDNYENTFISEEFMTRGKELSKELFAKKTKKGAVLGVTGLKKLLLTAFNKFSTQSLRPFDTKEEALEYLVTD